MNVFHHLLWFINFRIYSSPFFYILTSLRLMVLISDLAMKQSWHIVIAYACENLVLAVCIFTSMSYELIYILVLHILGFSDIQNFFFKDYTMLWHRNWKRAEYVKLTFSLVQFSRSVISDSLQPHELQHTRPPCPSPTPRVHPNPCPLCWWCHPTISSSVGPFSSCP